jgi:ribulose kinase
MAIVAGVDVGTLSVRVSLVDSERGLIESASAEYPLHRKREDPEYATQSHDDQMRALALQSLGEYYLWCDHRAKGEAAEITAAAHREGLEAIKWCGGVYSSEWGFSKLLHWLRHNPEKRREFVSAFEHCDMVAWDNGDRTVLVNPNLRGVTLGWNLQSTAQDELFAAIEGTAFHTRVILDRMAGNGVHIKRVINAGGIPQKNDVLSQVYANVLGRPVLVPARTVISLGFAIFAFLAAGTFKTIEEAQDKICPPNRTFAPEDSAQRIYGELYPLYNKLYFALGQDQRVDNGIGVILPALIALASRNGQETKTQ